MKRLLQLMLVGSIVCGSLLACAQETAQAPVIVGAARTDVYVPKLDGMRLALLSNQTGMVGDKHVLDLMLEKGLVVTTIFSPEHGFRGTADAGEHVSSSVDERTGITIASLYDGKSPMPSAETMEDFDAIVVDIQDVGTRFYTYYITMINLMEAAARYHKKFYVFDRPNPNGMYVDGPVLDMSLRSGVGRLPIPTVHGMTLGELALMANTEGWLKDSVQVELEVIPCLNYTHQTRYQLPIAPSPNLPNMTAVYLYPSLCYFEGTTVSLGRGTDLPFQCYGHPELDSVDGFTFTPESRPGAKNPPLMGQLCNGRDLHNLDHEAIIAAGINLDYLNDVAVQFKEKGVQLLLNNGNFFDKLMGDRHIKDDIGQLPSARIKAGWQEGIERFKQQRRPYLLYPE